MAGEPSSRGAISARGATARSQARASAGSASASWTPSAGEAVRRGTGLSAGDRALIGAADTFLLGNLAVEPAAALLFADFGTGRTLQLSGTAVVEWTEPGAAGDDGGTGRRVRFTPQCVVVGTLLPARAVTG